MKRIEIVAYTEDDDVDEDVDRIVHYTRGQLAPELIIVGKTDITPERLAAVVREHEEFAL